MASSTLAKKRTRTLAILAGLLCVFLVAGWVSTMLSTEDEDASADQESETFLDISASDVETVTWSYGGVTYGIECDDGTWISSDEPTAAVDQDSAAALAEAAAEALVSREIASDAGDGTDAMGLDDPEVEATLGLSDGTTVTFALGADTSDGASCYASRNGEEEVFVVDADLKTAFSCTIADLYAVEEAPDASDVVSLEIDRGGETFTVSYYEEGLDSWYSSQFTGFADDGSGQCAIDSSSASTFVSLVNELSWASVVDPLDDGTGDYGFDEPTLTATLTYTESVEYDTGEVDDDGEAVYETQDEEKTYVLVVGAQASNGDYYARPEGSSAVYTLAAEDVEELLETTVADLEGAEVCLMDWDTVESVEVTCSGTTKTIEIERSVETDDDGNETVTTTYLVDGEDANDGAVEEFFDALDALEAEGTQDDAALSGDEPELSITFHRNTAQNAEMTLSFVQHDNSFYAVSFNGGYDKLVNRNDVSELEELVGAL